ncbi:hypothetical protein CHS0354_027907 [Potamilus streckersoni]|uniref:Uncharacterized protein n=1 Tax=Potamilus streckersoni TaxID=2493646 RepID=A0AAE0W6Q4_9BIVA|nr:hypothetical protein CHS0354_027907 [Potamilus streckersoni]
MNLPSNVASPIDDIPQVPHVLHVEAPGYESSEHVKRNRSVHMKNPAKGLKTKPGQFRLVFDSSAPSQGIPLNDVLLAGANPFPEGAYCCNSRHPAFVTVLKFELTTEIA